MERLESDSMGTIAVPADRYWGAQTQRSLEHFRIGTERFGRPMIRALGLVKQACARVNGELGLLSPELARAIVQAAGEVADGRLDEHFPLSVWQTGSGTQTNMNANEVIANRASELLGGVLGAKDPVHPNDHVNLGQSSNDVFPTAMHVAVVEELTGALVPSVRALQQTLAALAARHAEVLKLGRTHLQDATPLTLGQEVGGWATLLDQGLARVEAALPGLYELAIGGTAVGTGLGAHPALGPRVAEALSASTGHPFVPAADRFAALSAHDALVAASGALRVLAGSLTKIANDVRWLASGPRAGLGELRIPDNEPGSSMMPGKVNPTQCEALAMVCALVAGNDVAIGIAGAAGNFELNVHKPLLAHALLQSVRLLADASRSFRDHCAAGITPNLARIEDNLRRSLMLVTALVPHLGYDAAARIAQHAQRNDLPLRDAALALGVAAEDFDRWVRPEDMLGARRP